MKIHCFKELMNEIAWSWLYPSHEFVKDEKGNFYCNKLYITPTEVSYKLERYELAPGVFEDVERFYEFLEGTENE
jgi:hypothetical protein